MKIHLIYTPAKKIAKYGELSEGIYPPLGLLYIASYLKKKDSGVEIKFTDGLLSGYEKTIEEIKAFNPDIVGVSFYTPLVDSAFSLIRDIKELGLAKKVIIGGPHVTAVPEESIEISQADVGVIGEGEVTFYELVKQFIETGNFSKLEEIGGIVYRDSGKIKKTLNRKYIDNLDDIPFPDRSLVNLNNYRGWQVYKRKPETSFFSSRGCPYDCTFCSNEVWNLEGKTSYRVRSAKNIADEIEELINVYGVREFFDQADEFNANLAHAKNVCHEIIDRGIDITWKAQLRAKPLTDEFAALLSKAGCWYVHLGIETANPETLKGIRKGITVEDAIRACEILKRHNIKVMGLFMLYNVWEEDGKLRYETPEMVQKTLEFANDLIDRRLIDFFSWSITTPYPGSDLFNTAKKYDLFKKEITDREKWIKDYSSMMELPGITEKDLLSLKVRGSFLTAKCLIKSGNVGIKDAKYFAQRAFKLFINYLKVKRV